MLTFQLWKLPPRTHPTQTTQAIHTTTRTQTQRTQNRATTGMLTTGGVDMGHNYGETRFLSLRHGEEQAMALLEEHSCGHTRCKVETHHDILIVFAWKCCVVSIVWFICMCMCLPLVSLNIFGCSSAIFVWAKFWPKFYENIQRAGQT